MKIVKLKGGLGNQLFQYSFAKLLEKESGDNVKLDFSAYTNLAGDMVRKPRILNYNLSLPIATEKDVEDICFFKHTGNSQSNRYRVGIALEALLNPKYYFEKNRAYQDVNGIKEHSYFDGYWQAYKYVDAVWEQLNADLQFQGNLSASATKWLEEILAEESVAVGIRRGDYLTVRPKHYGNIGLEYYQAGMKYIAQRKPEAVFYIFSNDIEWVKANMPFEQQNIAYITGTADDFEDFILMTNCKHAIIPNSTYHWWGARRYDKPEKIVVAPKNWFADNTPINIVLERWTNL